MFANSTCFDDDLMTKMAAAVSALKEGAIVVTTTDPVPSPALEVLEEVSTDQLAKGCVSLLSPFPFNSFRSVTFGCCLMSCYCIVPGT